MNGEFYCIPLRREFRHGEEYRTVDLPDEVPHDWLAPQGPDFGLFEILAGSSWVPSASSEPVGHELALLLRSACGYPPALALARERVLRLGLDLSHRPTFEREYGALLRSLLDAQPTSPFILARSRTDHSLGYVSANQYVWVVCRSVDGSQVGWVTADHFVYLDAAEEFEIDAAQVERLPVAGLGPTDPWC